MSEDIKKTFEDDENKGFTPSESNNTSKPSTNKFTLLAVIAVLIIGGFLAFNGLIPKKNKQHKEQAYNTDIKQVSLPQNYSSSADGGREDEQIRALRMDNEELRKAVELSQKNQQEMYNNLSERIISQKSSAGGGDNGSSQPTYRSSYESERFTPEYQSKVKHFKENSSNFWSVKDDEFNKLIISNQIAGIPAEYQNISQDVQIQANGLNYIIPSGSRIIAVTEQPVNSDHPGFFTSRIVRPYILKDAKLICQAGPQQNNRIPVNPIKVIFNNKEFPISGQVEMTFPGLEGKVTNHWPSRLLPTMVNAAIAGSFIAWSASQQNNNRINTQDAITSSVVEQTVPGVESEIARFGGDKPNTVEIPQGQQFSILITDKIEVKY